MQLKEYQNIYKQEDNHWWYKSLHDLVFCFLNRLSLANDSSLTLLDAGCGTGGTLRSLQNNYHSWTLVGVDLSSVALSYCRIGQEIPVIQACVDFLPFDTETIDVVVCLDVLYHLSVRNDQTSLKEIYRVIKKGGYIFVHLPAFEFLRGSHDKVVFTRERYTKSKLYNRIKQAGFEVVRCSYRHMILFPFICTKKIIDSHRIDKFSKSDLQPLPPWLNNTLNFISCCENRILKYFNLPIGSSILCLARKS